MPNGDSPEMNTQIDAELQTKMALDRIEEVFLNNPEEILHESLIDDKEFIN